MSGEAITVLSSYGSKPFQNETRSEYVSLPAVETLRVAAGFLFPSPSDKTLTASLKSAREIYAPICFNVTVNRSSFWKRIASYDAHNILPRFLSFTRFS